MGRCVPSCRFVHLLLREMRAESTQRIQKYFIVLEEHGVKFSKYCKTVKGSVRLFLIQSG
uniref:Uncharacterized protein n=1 Tax=Arundo donax TaxID=35708 RepID=A0A0A9FGK9_ARUDO